jgi:hypothetical protein
MQAIHAKLLRQLDGLFEPTISIAKGEVKRYVMRTEKSTLFLRSNGRNGFDRGIHSAGYVHSDWRFQLETFKLI